MRDEVINSERFTDQPAALTGFITHACAVTRRRVAFPCGGCGSRYGCWTLRYVLLDLHDPDTMTVYPTREGTECVIF